MGLEGGVGCGVGGIFTSTGVILVLFILLVIVLRACI
ncbi:MULTISPECIES: YjcZ family sporulation protein [unclassified Paenibacillus]